jgi:hypothetical protein
MCRRRQESSLKIKARVWRHPARISDLKAWQELFGIDTLVNMIRAAGLHVEMRMVMDVQNSSREAFAPIIQHPYHGGANQQWKRVPLNL